MLQSPLADDDAGAATQGLTTEEVQRRRQAGLANDAPSDHVRSVWDIVRANTLTRFNAIIGSLVAVILVVGDPIDAAFGLVTVLNSGIGIVQELRARRTLSRVQVLVVPSIFVVRDGREQQVRPEELVVGDIIRLVTGDQVPVDGRVLAAEGIAVDESALTGESDPVPKRPGDDVLSGSAVVSGSALAEAVRVGEQSWAQKLTAEARGFTLTRSELRVGIDRLLRIIGFLLPPLAAILVWSQLGVSATLADALVSAVAGLVALVPQGLVLLVSMTMAIAVIRLARNQVVVQELQAVEGLARVDALCIDKTGTLTTGRFTVEVVEPIGVDGPLLAAGLAALTGLDPAQGGTIGALRGALSDEDRAEGATWVPEATVSFSSARKWSGARFRGRGTWVLGAPEIILDAGGGIAPELSERVDRLASRARRVLLVAASDQPFAAEDELPAELRPVGLVVLAEEIRADAAAPRHCHQRIDGLAC